MILWSLLVPISEATFSDLIELSSVELGRLLLNLVILPIPLRVLSFYAL